VLKKDMIYYSPLPQHLPQLCMSAGMCCFLSFTAPVAQVVALGHPVIALCHQVSLKADPNQ
jgi:hypothetical protein